MTVYIPVTFCGDNVPKAIGAVPGYLGAVYRTRNAHPNIKVRITGSLITLMERIERLVEGAMVTRWVEADVFHNPAEEELHQSLNKEMFGLEVFKDKDKTLVTVERYNGEFAMQFKIDWTGVVIINPYHWPDKQRS